MGFFSGVKKVAGSLVDVRVDRWFSFSYVKDSTLGLKNTLTAVFLPKYPRYSETFDEAVDRLNLNEQTLKKRQREFILLVFFFLFLSLSLIAYAIYWATQKTLSPVLICFALCAFCLAQAFRFHFWYFQMKHRKLGCTLNEWLNSRINATEVSKQ